MTNNNLRFQLLSVVHHQGVQWNFRAEETVTADSYCTQLDQLTEKKKHCLNLERENQK